MVFNEFSIYLCLSEDFGTIVELYQNKKGHREVSVTAYLFL